MYLLQTKQGSRASGGPQYYFHDLSEPVKLYLRSKGAVSVALVTPYGATKSDFFAVSPDHKLDHQYRPIPGKVGHPRVQQGRAKHSIGEAVRYWYNLPDGNFERIDIDIEILENVFYITPLYYKVNDRRNRKPISTLRNPLTFTRDHISPLWARQLDAIQKHHRAILYWSLTEIDRVIADHRSKLAHIQEPDLLRASGPLSHLGVKLGAYLGKGYDCITSIQFLDYPVYTIPLEIKKRSKDFSYQEKKYGKEELSRALVMCAFHDHKVMPKNIDVIELDALCDYVHRLSA